MAQVRFFKFDTDGFQVEHDILLDDLTVNSLAVDSGISMGSSKVTGLADGTLATDAVNKGQLDSLAAGFDRKESCRVATTGTDLGATYAAGGGAGGTGQFTLAPSSLDGVTLAQGDRVVVKNQTAQTENGIYEVTATTTTWDRASDADTDAEVTAGMFTFVTEGTANADTGWFVTTNDPITLNTTGIAWSQFAGVGSFTGGDGIDVSSGVISVDLGTDPGLEFVTNQLEVLVNPAGAIEKVTAGIGVNLEATNPSLQIASNELGVKFAASASALSKDATGLLVNVDGTSIQINGSNNLEVVSAGSADHVENQYTAAVAVAKADPVFVSSNDNVTPCDNTNNNTRKYVGVALAAATATNPVDIQSDGIIAGATVGGSPTAGDLVYLATPNGLTVTLPTGSGTHRLVVGKMKNATDVVIEPQYLGKIA